MKKRGEEQRQVMISGLSHTEAFVKKIAELLKQGLTAEDYEVTLQSVIALCKDDYDLNRAGAAAMAVAEKQPDKSEAFSLYCKMAGDLYRRQCESERSYGRTTIFTEFYNSAIDVYLDGGFISEAIAVAFEHSNWLMRDALYREKGGKQKYLELSVKAFDELVRRCKGEVAAFVYDEREGRRESADALLGFEARPRLARIKDPARLRASVQGCGELTAFLEQACKTRDVATHPSRELANVLESAIPGLAGECVTLAEEIQHRHGTLLAKHHAS